MAMQFDVLASQPLAATGSFLDQNSNTIGRFRIKAISIICGASAGSVAIADGSGGPTLITVNTPTAANQGAVYMLLPGQGILARNGFYGTLANVASVTLIYG